MLRLTVNTEEYLMIGDDIRIAFLGGTKNHTRVMLDIPKEVNVVRGKVLEKGRLTRRKRRNWHITMRSRNCKSDTGRKKCR